MAASDFRKALSSASELDITFIGRKTGKKFSTPVWFANEGEKLYLLPVNGSATSWYRNILKNPIMELEVSGKKTTAEARPTNDRKLVDAALERFRAKYGAGDVKRYYPRTDVAVILSV